MFVHVSVNECVRALWDTNGLSVSVMWSGRRA